MDAGFLTLSTAICNSMTVSGSIGCVTSFSMVIYLSWDMTSQVYASAIEKVELLIVQAASLIG